MRVFRDLALPLLASCLFHLLVLVFSYSRPMLFDAGGNGAYKQRRQIGATLRPLSTAKEAGALQNADSEEDRLDAVKQEESPPESKPEVSGEKPLKEDSAARPSVPSFPPAGYVPSEEATVAPQPLGDPLFEAEEPSGNPASGTVVLDLWISERGDVVYTVPKDTDLPEKTVQIVEKAFRNLRFIPGELNGRKVSVVMRVEVRYGEASTSGP